MVGWIACGLVLTYVALAVSDLVMLLGVFGGVCCFGLLIVLGLAYVLRLCVCGLVLDVSVDGVCW